MIDYNDIIKRGRSLLADMYGYGYAEGQKRVSKRAEDEETVEDIYRKGFENGLEQAWECAKKIVALSYMQRSDIFERPNIIDLLDDYSASEAIAKIKEYEQKQTEKVNISELKAVCDDLRGVTALENAIRWYETTAEMSLSDAINWMKDYFRTTDMPMPQYEKAFEMAIKSMEYIDDHAL